MSVHTRRARPGAAAIPVLALLGVTSACASDSGAAGANNLDAAPDLEYEEVLRIGSVDDPDYGFTAINGVDVDRDGNIHVFEGSDAQFRVYSPDGELLRRIGRRGEGPGEFRGAPRFGILGDTIWAVESFGRRLSLFTLDGSVISTAPIEGVTVPLQTGLGIVMPTLMLDDGFFLGELAIYTSSRDMEITVARDDTVQVPRVRFGADGVPIDTVGWMPRLPPRDFVSDWLTIGGSRYLVPQPPSDDPILVGLPDGYLMFERPTPSSAEPASMELTRFDLAGDTVFSRGYAYTPHAFDDASLATEAWARARTPGGGVRMINGVPQPEPVADDSMEVFNRLREAMDYPAFQTPVRSVRPANDGGVWLGREEDGGATRRWTILDSDGRLVGNVVLDRGLFPYWMDGESFFVAERDEFDVPWLVRYRLLRGQAGRSP